MAIDLTRKPELKTDGGVPDADADVGAHIRAADELRLLTENFRSGLSPWRDANGDTRKVVIRDEEKVLLEADADKIKAYAKAYTEIWSPQDDETKREMRHQWFINCEGLVIKGSFISKCRQWAPVRFDHSIFKDSFSFSNRVFLGRASFRHAEFIGHVGFEAATFKGAVTFDDVKFQEGANFSNAQFEHTSSFQRVTSTGGILNFTNASFKRAPVFHETKLPQGTSFDGTTFPIRYKQLTQAEVEQEARAFRTLKQAAASYRGQQDEAEFFALEQQARRIAFLAPHLVWSDTFFSEPKSGLRALASMDAWRRFKDWKFRFNPFEWIVSLLYGSISGYGRAPGRAISCFIAANVIALGIFFAFFDFGTCSTAGVDYCSSSANLTASLTRPALKTLAPPAHLMVQNLLNPAGLVTEKALISVRNPLMLSISIAQFASAYLILFLVALAIRTRFQKGGGGDR